MSYTFFFNDTATTEIYTLSLHDALPIYAGLDEVDVLARRRVEAVALLGAPHLVDHDGALEARVLGDLAERLLERAEDRKSTRLNSSHANISYAVFCLKKQKDARTLLPDT